MKILNFSITIHTQASRLLSLFSLLFVVILAHGQEEKKELSFLFVGDVMGHDGQIEGAYNPTTNSYDYDDGFKFIKPIINEYDLKIANLEITHAGPPYKGYPQFSSPDELSETLVNSGFNVILTSNNHSCDGRSKGVTRTLDVLDKLGVKHTGTFRNQAERDSTYPLMIEQNGIRVALLNYTYGTNGLTVPPPLIINYIDSVIIKKDIARAKELKADYIICNMHWGAEYQLIQNKYQEIYEKVCYRAGADMVIGGHPHCLQPIEKKEINGFSKLTVWSLGNFVSNMQTRITRGGVMVGAHVEKDNNKVVLGDVDYHLIYVMKKKEGKITPFYILPDFNYNKFRPGFVSSEDAEHMRLFFADSRKLYGEHNKGTVNEKIVTEESDVGQRYKQLLTRYYSIQVAENGNSLMSNDLIGHYFHRSVDATGKRNYLSGMYFDPSMAKGHLQFLRDCGVEGLTFVEVTPDGIKPVIE